MSPLGAHSGSSLSEPPALSHDPITATLQLLTPFCHLSEVRIKDYGFCFPQGTMENPNGYFPPGP